MRPDLPLAIRGTAQGHMCASFMLKDLNYNNKHLFQVCCEETMTDILVRYLQCNAHAASYTWKFAKRCLDMEKTLEENGIPDEDAELEELLLNVDDFIPEIFLYYNDDLTEA